MGELEKMICESAPPRPRIDDDLDRIILHALEKDPKRRYATAGDMADDLDRYLHGFPVTARGPSRTYQLRKFCQRYKLAVGSALAVFLVLSSFSVAMVVQARRLQQERNSAERVSQFLESIFARSNPANARGKQLSQRESLDMGAAEVERATDLDPLFKDQLLNTLATTYRTESIFDRAYELNSESLEIRKRLYGERSPQVAETLGQLADLDMYSEDYYRAYSDEDKWFAIIQPIDNRYDNEALAALRLRATLEVYHNQLGKGAASLRQAIEVARRVDGSESFEVYNNYLPLGNILYYEGDWEQAETVYRTALDHFRKDNWRDSPYVITEMEAATRLGFLLGLEGRYQEAEPLLRETTALRLKILGFAHDSTGASEAATGYVLGKMGKVQEAEKMGQDGLRSREQARGASSRNYGVDEGLLAVTYLDEGKPQRAEPLLEQDVELCRLHLGAESFLLARAMSDLGRVQLAERKLGGASENLHAALAMEIRLNGDTSPFAAADHEALGTLLAAQGNLPEAEASLRQALGIYRTTAKMDRPDMADTLRELGRVLQREGRGGEAGPLLAESAEIRAAFRSAPSGSRPQ
jgi:serine/threonine-protein kinase